MYLTERKLCITRSWYSVSCMSKHLKDEFVFVDITIKSGQKATQNIKDILMKLLDIELCIDYVLFILFSSAQMAT